MTIEKSLDRLPAHMPQRKITIPSPIQIIDPESGQSVPAPQGVLDFQAFLTKLFSNPLWNESWKHGMAQQSISRALKEATAKNEPTLMVAEEDWEFLATAAKNPRTAVLIAGAGMQVISGFGYLPSVAGQIVPMQLAVINAEVV
jgi:hypothetical protein